MRISKPRVKSQSKAKQINKLLKEQQDRFKKAAIEKASASQPESKQASQENQTTSRLDKQIQRSQDNKTPIQLNAKISLNYNLKDSSYRRRVWTIAVNCFRFKSQQK